MMPKREMCMAGWNIIRFESIDSTNSEAKRCARDGLREKTLFWADTQTAGRGRFDRKWESPAGAGLWMTQLFQPRNIKAEAAGGAVFLSAVALAGTLREMTGADIMIKWPNDLVLNGKKICGMLAECGFRGDMCDWIALGTGLNILKGALPEELVYATSIENETGMRLDADELVARYLKAFDEVEKEWESEGLAPVIERMLPLSATVGSDVRVDGVPAKALYIDNDGALVCRFEDGVRRVLAGDVSVRGITDYV